MDDDHAARGHLRVKVVQPGEDGLVEIGVEMYEGEPLFLPARGHGAGKKAGVDDDIFRLPRGDAAQHHLDAGVGKFRRDLQARDRSLGAHVGFGEAGKGIEKMQRALGEVVVEKPRRVALIDAEFDDVAGDFAFEDRAQQQDEHVAADEVAGVKVGDLSLDRIAGQKEAAGLGGELRAVPARDGVDVHLPLEKVRGRREAGREVVLPALELMQHFRARGGEVAARVGDEFGELAEHGAGRAGKHTPPGHETAFSFFGRGAAARPLRLDSRRAPFPLSPLS